MFIYKKCSCAPSKHERDDISEFNGVARKMKLLSAPSRIAILSVLYRAPHCVSALQVHTGLSQTLVSHHLKDLMKEGFVKNMRDGTFIRYRLTSHGRRLVGFVRDVKNTGVVTKINNHS
jgi:DNA-binding transcriptional ArsR family regulator